MLSSLPDKGGKSLHSSPPRTTGILKLSISTKSRVWGKTSDSVKTFHRGEIKLILSKQQAQNEGNKNQTQCVDTAFVERYKFLILWKMPRVCLVYLYINNCLKFLPVRLGHQISSAFKTKIKLVLHSELQILIFTSKFSSFFQITF
jgi:hypothetical protein